MTALGWPMILVQASTYSRWSAPHYCCMRIDILQLMPLPEWSAFFLLETMRWFTLLAAWTWHEGEAVVSRGLRVRVLECHWQTTCQPYHCHAICLGEPWNLVINLAAAGNSSILTSTPRFRPQQLGSSKKIIRFAHRMTKHFNVLQWWCWSSMLTCFSDCAHQLEQ